MTFYQFLKQQVKRNDPIGDLARDAKCFEGVPKRSSNFYRWNGYLLSCQACQEAHDALKEAFEEFTFLTK